MEPITQHKKILLIKNLWFLSSISLLLYLVILFFGLPSLGGGVTAFTIVPVMIIGWLTNDTVKGLIIGFLGSFVTNSFVFSVYYHESILTALINHQGIPGSIIITLAGGISGYLSNLQKRYKEEILSRRKIQLELEKSKERIEHILRTIPSAVFITDREMRVKLWNRTAEALTGLKEEEVLGKKCLDIWYCRECQNCCGLKNEEFKKPVFGKELEIVLKDGRKITIVKNVDILLDESGNFDGGIESFIDITDRKKMENELYETAEGFRTLFDKSKEGMLLIEPLNGNCIEINPSACEISGYTREELIGKPHTILFDIIDVLDRRELMKKIKDGIPVNNIEGKIKRKDGEVRYVIIGAAPVFWKGKKVFFGYLQDITPLKILQFELEKKNREIINLTNTITHDLRNPLTGIRGIFELNLLDNKKLDENDRTLFRMALKEIEYMQSLLEDLLDAAKIDESNKEIKKEEVYVKEIIGEVLDILRFQTKEKNIEVIVDLDNVKVLVDPHQFKKALMNIIGNAINYTDINKKPQIIIIAKESNDAVELSVKDNGIGIPKDSLELIFEKFKRGTNTKNIKGTGLGLFIVKNIIEKHGGRISVESKAGEGSTFTIILPKKL